MLSDMNAVQRKRMMIVLEHIVMPKLEEKIDILAKGREDITITSLLFFSLSKEGSEFWTAIHKFIMSEG